MGEVYDVTTVSPISGIEVAVLPASGGCPNGLNCSALTDPAGKFRISSPPGAVKVAVFPANSTYLSNYTYATVTVNQTTNVGRIYLVHAGYAKGVVLADRTPFPPLQNVGVSALSRDGQLVGEANFTNRSGWFLILVPPVPTRLDFSLSGYANNSTYVNATPYEVVDVGTIFLEGGISLRVTPVDSFTKLPVQPSAYRLCERRPVWNCALAPYVAGGTWTGSLPGALGIEAGGPGYVDNETAGPDVPNLPFGRSFDAGAVGLLPMGVVNFTIGNGGSLPSNFTWSGIFGIMICSLDGFHYADIPCLFDNVSAGIPHQSLAFPLRNVLIVTGGATSAPIAFRNMTCPIPNCMPIQTEALAWFNSTPDRQTNLSFVNVSLGGWFTGVLHYANGTAATNASARACSVRQGLCAFPGTSPSNCRTGPGAFCIPAPAGPDEIVAKAAKSGPFDSTPPNMTWASIPYGCCSPLFRAVDVGIINLSAVNLGATLTGHVALRNPTTGQTYPPGNRKVIIEVCPVDGEPIPLGNLPCGRLLLTSSTDGAFNLSVPLGWDLVTVSVFGYTSNWTWVWVNGTNDSGTIVVDPWAIILGQVLGSDGVPVYEAVVKACTVVLPSVCAPKSGTNTYGQYGVGAPGGPYPVGAYQVQASASGFQANWTWVNATYGATVYAPTIRLSPVTASPLRWHPAAQAYGGGGVWVIGRIRDNQSGFGVADASLDACPLGGGTCLSASRVSTAGGTFNVSFPSGRYDLYVSVGDYVAVSVPLNTSGRSQVDLGSISIQPYPFVRGLSAVSPWLSLGSTLGEGPGMPVVKICNNAQSACGSSIPANSAGFFNASAPESLADALQVFGTGGLIGGYNTANNGFDEGQTNVDATSQFIDFTPPSGNAIPLAIFASYSGQAGDGPSYNATSLSYDRGVDLLSLSYSGSAGLLRTGTGSTSAHGEFTFFLSASNRTTAHFQDMGYWGSDDTYSKVVLPGGAVQMAPAVVSPYGFIVGRLVAPAGGPPSPFVIVSAVVYDRANGTGVYAGGESNGAGVFNVSAPFGGDQFSVNDTRFRPYAIQVPVSADRVSSLGTVNLTVQTSNNISWIRSTEVNTVGVPVLTTVTDLLTGNPIASALAVPRGLNGTASGGIASTNELGQFLLTAEPVGAANLSVSAGGYVTNLTPIRLKPGGTVSVRELNLTGYGIVAGRIVESPSGTPISGIEVDVCPVGFKGCSTYGLTNGEGVFWIAAPPGPMLVEPVSDTYLANATQYVVIVSDSWVWAGTVPVYAFGTVKGMVLGLPSGSALSGANVSICLPGGYTSDYCFEWTNTTANGTFEITAIPGLFNVRVSLVGYNSTFIAVGIPSGKTLDMGTLFLFADAVVQGLVENASTHDPIAGAVVRACANGAVDVCSDSATTNGSGAYLLLAPPGQVQLSAIASGYQDTVIQVSTPSGMSVTAPTLYMIPATTSAPQTVSGRVVLATNASQPIAGASVVALAGGGVQIASTTTDSQGSFSLQLTVGIYTLRAAYPGLSPTELAIDVTAPISGLILEIGEETFPVTGQVTSGTGGSSQPVPGAQLDAGANGSAVTDSGGFYRLLLPNGTFAVHVVPQATSGLANVTVVIAVNGAAVRRDISLTSTTAILSGVVVSSVTGLAIVGASVAVAGSTTGFSTTTAADQFGTFSLTLTPGAYVLTVVAPGFQSASVTVNLTASSPPLTISLTPVGPTAAGVPVVYLIAGVAAGAAAGIAGFLVWRRRRPPTLPLDSADAIDGGPVYYDQPPTVDVSPELPDGNYESFR